MMKKTNILAALSAVLVAAQMALVSAAYADSAQRACFSDYKKFCSDVERGGGRVKQCFMEHRDELSPGCREAMDEKLSEMKAKEGDAAPADTTVPATAGTAPQTTDK